MGMICILSIKSCVKSPLLDFLPMDMADYTIAILPGDGVGREVSVEAIKS